MHVEDYLDHPSCPDANYEGHWIEYWDDGQIKYRGRFEKNCCRQGQHVAFSPSGFVVEISYWKDNRIVGTKLNFHEEGEVFKDTYYGNNGSITGDYATRMFRDDVVYSLTVYKEHRHYMSFESQAASDFREEAGIDQIMKSALADLMAENERIQAEVENEDDDGFDA